MRILFTGGSGKAGRHVVAYLLDQGHRVLNVDRVPLDLEGVDNRIADITDAGQVYDVMSSLAGLDELEPGTGVPRFDAVVHFAAIPRILVTSDNECYRVNTLGTYNIIDAAVKFGIRKIVFASSETTYGVCFADGERKPDFLPVDETHPTVPEDSYAMSKVCNEVTARSFQARSGCDIYGLRINNVIEPHEYAQDFPAYMQDPALRRRNIFAYIDARDLGQMVDRCLATDGLGYEVFNVSNDDHSVGLSTSELIERFYEGVPVKGTLGETETLYSNRKAKEMLGYQPRHGWRDVLG
ncbi:Nucleoside-diphosphate-sugar epimerase [Mameliella alba]|uniref:NAD-dependent epimerase/dehydratase family protein n=1 Tax=Mameliella alba TaxID=561184 RepID=UPI00088F2960|nr:NAD(P)-dependent oxidoreductase [Mameliella alba]OWV41418.1 NAD(P)-dependent oxidoreductase [Mameliella alba]PTR38896.1 nucleoside-diphosphate-sugar epimerase [Mameliella alba]GGF70351.1 nucleoside-diphosphate-sugar epimerase [Mameliella alba]SDD46817.1 Nucleoside-diphosphate-sugar epimerase [Mameliella alba]